MPKLILGTATFGTGYGISNKGSYVASKDIFEIVSAAQTNGIDEFDTAPAYGFAEGYLGLSLNQEFSPKVSSKVSKDHCESAELILRSVKNTIRNTKVQKISNLYLHDPEVLNGPKASEAIAGLKEALASGLVERIGLSVYTLDSLLRAKDLFPELSVFQVPENICDRRMLNSKELMDLKCDDNVLIVRSIFLQGLLLMELSEVPTKLNSARKLILELSKLAKANQITPLDVCLAYGQAISWASGIVVGAVNASQVIQIVESRIKLEDSWLTKIDTASLEILDPRRW
jgi:aryl-alcohol dehydrogenase-like predicted oxidoreductase